MPHGHHHVVSDGHQPACRLGSRFAESSRMADGVAVLQPDGSNVGGVVRFIDERGFRISYRVTGLTDGEHGHILELATTDGCNRPVPPDRWCAVVVTAVRPSAISTTSSSSGDDLFCQR